MHIVFVDTADWSYDIDAPLNRPIGGTQSAACYLMKALAARGIQISFINKTEPYEKYGIKAWGQYIQGEIIRDADVVVFISDPRLLAVETIRNYVNADTKFVLWLHHAYDQPVVQFLNDPLVCVAWDHIVYLSDWQRNSFIETFPALVDRPASILRNAISPAFENLFEGLPVLVFKQWPPVLFYTSTPFRGLDRLLYAFQEIGAQLPGARCHIYSSMQVYNVAPEHDEHRALYDVARMMPNVDYIGPLPQGELAPQLRASLCLAYPNTFEETSCIAVMEAMAAGCLVVTSNLGALPETLHGFGVLTEFIDDAVTHATDFAAHCVATLQQARQDWNNGVLEGKLSAQVAWVNDNYTWAKRAAEWDVFLHNLAVSAIS